MYQSNYADLEIRIFRQTDAGYPVELTLNHERQFFQGYLDPAVLAGTAGKSTDKVQWLSTADPDADGQRLYDWLFHDDTLKVNWAEIRGISQQRRVRLRIDACAPELHTIPWELLREPGDGGVYINLAITISTPFSRYLAGDWLPGRPVVKRPIRILVAIANPINLEAR